MMLMSGIYTFRKLVLLVLGICWLNTLGAAEPEKVVYKVEMLNVFLLLALPVDALKLPSVPMVEPFTQSISGGTS